MGLFKKAKRLVKKPRKLIKKLIPKEIRPFVPYIAAAMGPAGLASSGIFANPAVTKALIAGGTKFATDDEADLKDIGITAALAASPDLIKQGSSSLAGRLDPKLAADIAGNIDEASSLKEATGITAKLASGLSKVGQTMPTLGEAGSTLGTQAKLVGGLGAVDATRKLAEIQQDELDEYNRKLREQGITGAADRRKAIRDIYLGVGYTEDYIDSMLDRYGYKEGGGVMAAASMSGFGKKYQDYLKKKKEKRVKKAGGGISEAAGPVVAQLIANGMDYEDAIELVKEEFPEDTTELDILKKRAEREDVEEISDYGSLAEEGFKSAFGVDSLFPTAPKPMGITPGFGNLPRMADGGSVDIGEQFEEFLMRRQEGIKDNQRRRLMEEFEQYMRRQDPTVEAAEGGLMNLDGNEMDLRGGGFVPIGKKEKADDVPARLSKNEFVMTADAVRGAGGGNVNEGAKRMYQTMDKLEAMA